MIMPENMPEDKRRIKPLDLPEVFPSTLSAASMEELKAQKPLGPHIADLLHRFDQGDQRNRRMCEYLVNHYPAARDIENEVYKSTKVRDFIFAGVLAVSLIGSWGEKIYSWWKAQNQSPKNELRSDTANKPSIVTR